MLNDDQFRQICEFTKHYLEESAASSERDWLIRFPRTAEYRWYHTLNVLRNADRILSEMNDSDFSGEVVRAAVILHDVSMFVCEHSVHGQVSADIAEQYLSDQDYPEEFVERVSRAIAEHGVDFDTLSPKEMGESFSWEGKILIEGDILDKLGASAVTSALLVQGKDDRLSFECQALLSEGRVMERAVFFKDYFWTESGKQMAEDRFGFFLRYLDQLAEEVVVGSIFTENEG